MSKDRLENFTDRREAIALFEALRGRDPAKPWPLLPILAFIAPGGSGKSTLLAYLRDKLCSLSYAQAAVPYAHLDFTRPDTPKDLLSILINLRDQLQHHDDGQGRHLTFPRFDLGALIAQSATNTDIATFTPTEIRRKLSAGKQGFEALTALGGALGYTVPFVAPLLAGVNLAGQINIVKDLLNYLEDNTGWHWYRMQGTATHLGPNATMKDVLRRLQVLSMPGKPERDMLIKELLPAAFLADLVETLVDTDPPLAWTNKVNVIFFLDGFEALQHADSATATRLLQVLTTEQRKQGKTDPLLLVIGSRDALPGVSEGEHRALFARTSVSDERTVPQQIQELQAHWQHLPVNRLRLKDLYLTRWLPDFGQDDTRSYLLNFGERERTAAFTQNEELVQTIDRVTHGHPLYLALAVEAVLEASGRGTTLTSDDFEIADVSPEVAPEHEGEQVRDYLLNLFLSQLSETEQRELIFCAVPRFLDVALLRTILQLSNDIEARERWERYRRLSFMTSIDTQRIMLHPLVRTLLLRQLPPDHESTSDYFQIHDRLRAYFHTRASTQRSPMQSGMEDWQIPLEEAYHALALGDPEPAINLGMVAQHTALVFWEPLLEAVTQAPTALMPANIEEQAYEALVQAHQQQHAQDEVKAIILYQWLLAAFQRNLQRCASLQHNLGSAYADLPTGDRIANIQQAIACYDAALQVRTREAFPIDWAATQDNLGNAYADLPAGDRAVNIQQAITCYETALQVRTREAFPVDWAATQNNLGNAYWKLPAGDHAANLQQTIACYEAALQVYHLTHMDYYSQIVSRSLEVVQEESRNLKDN